MKLDPKEYILCIPICMMVMIIQNWSLALSQHSRYIWEDTVIEWHERDVWDAENVLYLDLCDGYMSINAYENSSSCAQWIMFYIIYYHQCLKSIYIFGESYQSVYEIKYVSVSNNQPGVGRNGPVCRWNKLAINWYLLIWSIQHCALGNFLYVSLKEMRCLTHSLG